MRRGGNISPGTNGVESSVYFIQCEETKAVKIGTSRDPEKRLLQLQTASPGKLTILGTVPGNKYREAELHNRFADRHVRGEWYSVTTEEVKAIVEPDIATDPDFAFEAGEEVPPDPAFTLEPRWKVEQDRADRLIAAIYRRHVDGMCPEAEWAEELTGLLRSIKARSITHARSKQDGNHLSDSFYPGSTNFYD